MNRQFEKATRVEAGAGPVIVDLRDRVLGMENAALASLHANATRLHNSGDPKQRAAAADLLPVIDAELARRAALKKKSPSKSAAARKAKKVVEAEADEEEETVAELD